jgi:hypothetical protein
MSLYPFLVSVHVIVAVLGLGPLVALALLTKRPPIPAGATRPVPPEAALRAFARVLRVSQASLGLMLITGITLVALTHGVFGRQLWMITSIILFFAVGSATGMAQGNLKKALGSPTPIAHVERAHRFLLGACGLVAVIAWLMQTKPF